MLTTRCSVRLRAGAGVRGSSDGGSRSSVSPKLSSVKASAKSNSPSLDHACEQGDLLCASSDVRPSCVQVDNDCGLAIRPGTASTACPCVAAADESAASQKLTHGLPAEAEKVVERAKVPAPRRIPPVNVLRVKVTTGGSVSMSVGTVWVNIFTLARARGETGLELNKTHRYAA